jgi:hypothetical protein
MSQKCCPIVSANDSILITENMRKICEVFIEEILKKSGRFLEKNVLLIFCLKIWMFLTNLKELAFGND